MSYHELPSVPRTNVPIVSDRRTMAIEAYNQLIVERKSEKLMEDTRAETMEDAMVFGKVLQDDDEESKEMSLSSSDDDPFADLKLLKGKKGLSSNGNDSDGSE